MPKVISIEKYKGKTLRIDFEDFEPLFIHADVALEYNLSKDADIPEQAIEELRRANDFRRAKERALYLLDERDYSYVELFKKLEPSYGEDIAYEVMSRLCEWGCINDRRYSEKLAEHLCLTKKYGYYRAREEMRKKGLPGELIDEALQEYRDGASQRLAEIIGRKYERYLGDEKGAAKVKAALVRLGYSYSQVNQAVSDYIEELLSEESEELEN